MQYWQRRLHRSVTDSRRFRSGRRGYPRAFSLLLYRYSHWAVVVSGFSRTSYRPPSRNRRLAGRTRPAGGDAVVPHDISPARHDRLAAGGAVRVFERADPARQVAGVDVAQAGRAADRGGAASACPRSCSAALAHLVVRVKRRDVPRDVRRHRREERRSDARSSSSRVVEAGNHQRDDLEPESRRRAAGGSCRASAGACRRARGSGGRRSS